MNSLEAPSNNKTPSRCLVFLTDLGRCQFLHSDADCEDTFYPPTPHMYPKVEQTNHPFIHGVYSYLQEAPLTIVASSEDQKRQS